LQVSAGGTTGIYDSHAAVSSAKARPGTEWSAQMIRVTPTPTVPTIWTVERDHLPADAKALYQRAELPTLAVFDDTADIAPGPSCWPCAPVILAWARALIIQADGMPDRSDFAKQSAVKFRRVALVRTLPQCVDLWRMAAEFAGCRRVLPAMAATNARGAR